MKIFRYFQCLHLMYSEVACVLVFFGIQVQSLIILEPDYLLNYLSVLYDYGKNRHKQDSKEIFLFCIFFLPCFAILQLCICFQYSIFLDWAILRKCLSTTLPVAGKKTAIHNTYTNDAHESP